MGMMAMSVGGNTFSDTVSQGEKVTIKIVKV